MTAETSPMSLTGAINMVVRIPRQAIPWRKNVIYTLWTNTMTPLVLNGRLRVSLLYRPTSTRSAPGSNPQTTGWWTIILTKGYREAEPHVFEWTAHGVYQYRFCMLWPLRAMQQFRASWRNHIMDGCLARIFLSFI